MKYEEAPPKIRSVSLDTVLTFRFLLARAERKRSTSWVLSSDATVIFLHSSLSSGCVVRRSVVPALVAINMRHPPSKYCGPTCLLTAASRSVHLQSRSNIETQHTD